MCSAVHVTLRIDPGTGTFNGSSLAGIEPLSKKIVPVTEPVDIITPHGLLNCPLFGPADTVIGNHTDALNVAPIRCTLDILK